MNHREKLTIALSLLASCATAQQIETRNTTINCGQVVYRQPVKAEFKMKNNGQEPLTITNVRTSCGCTTVEYPTNPIAAGESFTISATYDAKTMGHFQKLVGVYSNAGNDPMTLTIKGVVVEKKTDLDYDGEYEYTIGDIKADIAAIDFDDVNRGDMPIQKIHLFNAGTEVLEPQLMHLPNYMRGEIKPLRIAPGHSGTATIQLDSRKLRNLGLTQTSIYLGMFPGDKVAPEKEIPLNIILTPDFEQLTDAQRANAPKLRLSKKSIDIGSFGNKERKKDEITITNEGKSTLTIRSLQMLTAGLEVSLSKQNIEPGGKAKLKVTAIASMLKKARSKPRILMITNDPEQPKNVINVNLASTRNKQ